MSVEEKPVCYYSPWAFTQAVREMECPKCKEPPGKDCRQPNKRRCMNVHTERVTSYRLKIGLVEFRRRHSISPIKTTFTELFGPQPTKQNGN